MGVRAHVGKTKCNGMCSTMFVHACLLGSLSVYIVLSTFFYNESPLAATSRSHNHNHNQNHSHHRRHAATSAFGYGYGYGTSCLGKAQRAA